MKGVCDVDICTIQTHRHSSWLAQIKTHKEQSFGAGTGLSELAIDCKLAHCEHCAAVIFGFLILHAWQVKYF